jgi:hypothetical protein
MRLQLQYKISWIDTCSIIWLNYLKRKKQRNMANESLFTNYLCWMKVHSPIVSQYFFIGAIFVNLFDEINFLSAVLLLQLVDQNKNHDNIE